MKKLTNTLLIGLSLFLLAACNPVDERLETTENYQQPLDLNLAAFDPEIVDTLANLEPQLHLMRHSGWSLEDGEWVLLNEISLINLITGEELANFEFGEEYDIMQIWVLEDEYFVVDLWITSFATGGISHSELVVFNDRLEIIKRLPYDIEMELEQTLSSAVLRFVDGNLFAYLLESRHSQLRELVNPLRINMHTFEVEVFENVNEYFGIMHKFIDNNQIFVTETEVFWDEGRVSSRYGILDLENESTQFFEKEDFRYGNLDFKGEQVLIGEMRSLDLSMLSEVTLFNFESMTSKGIALEGEESAWARFAYDENYIVTVNEEASAFRKYDVYGRLVTEVEIEMPTTISGVDEFTQQSTPHFSKEFEIFSLTPKIYVILTTISFTSPGAFLSDYHLQLVILP